MNIFHEIQLGLFASIKVTQLTSTMKGDQSQNLIKKERWGRGINQEVGSNIYSLLYIKEVTKKDPLCSVESFTEYSVTTYMGKVSGKEQIYENV